VNPRLTAEFTVPGRVAVVTGAASGIGAECARVLAEAGARVLLADLNEDGLAATADSIRGSGGECRVQACNVADRAAVQALAALAGDIYGGLDIWVSAAGTLVRRLIHEASNEDIDRLSDVNLKGVYWGCVAARQAMEKTGGSIVNISSTGGEGNNPGLSIYAMSKASVNALTRTAAKEFGPLGIRVNAVAPGWVETPLAMSGYLDADGRISNESRAELISQREAASPLGTTGRPRDIALAVLYLASDASRFVTGQILRPNGGVTMP